RRIPPALLLVGLLAGGGARAEEPAEWERDAPPDLFYVSPMDASGNPTHVVFRVVDDVSGEPLPGATATLRQEDDEPVTGIVAAIRTGVADAEGWIRMRADDLGWEPTWLGVVKAYVEAPGHAGLAYTKGTGGEARLARARDVVVEVRDAFDRPVAGATIGVHSAGLCGHMPDLRAAVTDLEGRAVIPALGFEGGDDDAEGWEAWVSGEGLLGDYHDIAVPLLPSPPQVLHHSPSPTVEGTILDAEGKPAAGVRVGTLNRHRGPWTTTDSVGCFRLVGTQAFEEITVRSDEVRSSPGPHEWPWFTAPPHGVRRILRLGPKGERAAPEPAHEVEVVLVDAATKAPIESDIPFFVAVRDGDGLTFEEPKRLPSGSWSLRLGGGATVWAEASARLEVKDEMPEPVRLEASRNPDLRIAFADDPDAVRVTLVTATAERAISPEELASGKIAVGVGVEAAFRIESGRNDEPPGPRVEFVPVPKERPPDAPPLRLHATAPLRLHARCEAPDGKPAAAWLTTDLERWLGAGDLLPWDAETPASPEPEVAVHASGSVDVLVVPGDRTFAPRVVTVAIPEGAAEGTRIDLGSVRFAPRGEPHLTVLLPDGTPAEWTSLRVIRGDVVRRGNPSEDRSFDAFPFTLATGDLVEVKAWWREDGAVTWAQPVRRRLEGPGPWTIRGDLPSTSIVLEPAETYPDLTLVVDGAERTATPWTADDGKRHLAEVAGLSPGPHQVAVSAPNHLTRLYRVVLKEGERRVLSPRLTPRPATAPK
ncbi:MAG TPA: hypothetical protein VND21_07800, partial [Planctomycetota bacterium]|nr:hypothetical protein [Planctomycetota bacterium]